MLCSLVKNFIYLCIKLTIIHYHTPKQRILKFPPRTKLNHNINTCSEISYNDYWTSETGIAAVLPCRFPKTNFSIS